MQETGHVLSNGTMRVLSAVVLAGMLLQTCLADVQRHLSTKVRVGACAEGLEGQVGA